MQTEPVGDLEKDGIRLKKITSEEIYNRKVARNDVLRYKTQNSIYMEPIVSPSKNWKKLSNVFRSLNSLKRYDTKNIGNDSEIDQELADYKQRLFANTIKNRQSEAENSMQTSYNPNFNFNVKSHALGNNANLFGQIDKEILKETIAELIVDGNPDTVSTIDKIIKKNPVGFSRDESDKEYFFNTPLKNGKNLFYIACQEGKFDVVKYMLEKNLNPFVKSKINDKDSETPLEVACRWNYISIVELLLEKVNFTLRDIDGCLKVGGISPTIENMLKKYKQKKFKKKNVGCCG